MKERSDIPTVFWNNEAQSLHAHCHVCNKELLESNSEYGIQKVVKRYPEQNTEQVLFEFALCLKCMGEARGQMSAQSKMAVEQFMRNALMAAQQSNSSAQERFWQGQCLLTDKKLPEMQEYQMAVACRGRKLLQEPVLLSDTALEQLNQLLSAETREEMERFKDDNFGWPPELAKLLHSGDLVLL